jgi:hypothetical protein
MKLKRVDFTTTNEKQRHVRALNGYVSSVFVGLQIGHLKRGEVAEVASLTFDRQSQQIILRLVYASGPKKGQPFRRMTTDDNIQTGQEADCIGLAYDDRAVFYYDDDQQSAPPQTETKPQQESDPPPAKPIEKQQGQRR